MIMIMIMIMKMKMKMITIMIMIMIMKMIMIIIITTTITELQITFRRHFHNCVSCVHNCDDQSSPQFNYVIFHIFTCKKNYINKSCFTRMPCELYQKLSSCSTTWHHCTKKKIF